MKAPEFPFVLWNYYKFLKSSMWSAAEYRSHQNKMLIKLIKHAGTYVPYYRELFRNIGLDINSFRGAEDMYLIPPLDKEAVRNNFENLKADNAHKYGDNIVLTSGSTGTPLKVLLDNRTSILLQASIMRCFSWAGYHVFKRSFGLQNYMHLNFDKNAGLQYDRWTNMYKFDVNHLSKTSAVRISRELAKVKPRFYVSYPTPLSMLGLHSKDAGIEVHSPDSIVLCAESLSEERKRIIVNVFKSKVYNFYSMRERAAMISTCPNFHLHLLEDFSYHEVVNDDNMVISSGEGELLGTNLYNFSMPLIRYKTRDIVEVNEDSDCPFCAFRTVKRIIGRQNDYVVTPSGKFLANSMEHTTTNIEGIVLSQCVQDSIDHIYFNLVVDKQFKMDSIETLHATITQKVGTDVMVDFKFVEELEKTQGGKNPLYFVQNWEPEYLKIRLLRPFLDNSPIHDFINNCISYD